MERRKCWIRRRRRCELWAGSGAWWIGGRRGSKVWECQPVSGGSFALLREGGEMLTLKRASRHDAPHSRQVDYA